MRIVMTDTHGELPVLDTWRQCRHTKTGMDWDRRER